jgi:hypothetical protein
LAERAAPFRFVHLTDTHIMAGDALSTRVLQLRGAGDDDL